MISYAIKLDLAGALRDMRALPAQIDEALDLALDRIGTEGVRVMRGEEPKAETTLVQSTHFERAADSVIITPGVRYAEYVHEGTGPAAGRAPYMPPPDHLYAYVKRRAGINFGKTKKGSAGREAQYDEIRDRAWALALYIKRHGTKPNRFADRAREQMEKRAPEILQAQLANLGGERA